MSRTPVLALLLLAACGGDDTAGADATIHGDGAVASDAAPPNCDYTEVDDVTNDVTGEVTGLTAGGAMTICGQLDAREPDSAGHVDVDRYAFTVAGDGDYLIRVDSAHGRDVALITANVGLPTSERSHGMWIGSHLAMFASLEAGAMVVEVVAWDEAAPVEPIAYAVSITPDDAATRCVPGAEARAYTEAGDGAGSRGNDMAEVVYDPEFAMTATADETDAPEPAASRATVTAGMQYKLAGSVADVATPGDAYRDRDTYLIATGADTNELTLRVTWPEGADLDYFVTPVAAGNADPIALWDGSKTSTDGTELQVGAVLPSTSYWLWVGGYDDAGVTWPRSYVITLCGAHY